MFGLLAKRFTAYKLALVYFPVSFLQCGEKCVYTYFIILCGSAHRLITFHQCSFFGRSAAIFAFAPIVWLKPAWLPGHIFFATRLKYFDAVCSLFSTAHFCWRLFDDHVYLSHIKHASTITKRCNHFNIRFICFECFSIII